GHPTISSSRAKQTRRARRNVTDLPRSRRLGLGHSCPSRLSLSVKLESQGEPRLFCVGNRVGQECPTHTIQGIAGRTGGGRGIRTPGTVSRTAVFKTARFNRSRIPPRVGNSFSLQHQTLAESLESVHL